MCNDLKVETIIFISYSWPKGFAMKRFVELKAAFRNCFPGNIFKDMYVCLQLCWCHVLHTLATGAGNE
jgi:hypothetical protein